MHRQPHLKKRVTFLKKQENAEGKQEELPDILPEYQAIYQENPEFAGWLTIPDSIVDYPVMKPKNDTDYYLDHTFSGEEDKNGTLFIDSRNDIVHRSTNIIIYGHNMKSSAMFGSLKNIWTKNTGSRIRRYSLTRSMKKELIL